MTAKPVTANSRRYPPHFDRRRPASGVWLFECAACDALSVSSRRNTLTCSGRCRVRLHRHPAKIAMLAAIAEDLGIPISRIGHAAAVRRVLGDEAAARVRAGRWSLVEAQNAAQDELERRSQAFAAAKALAEAEAGPSVSQDTDGASASAGGQP